MRLAWILVLALSSAPAIAQDACDDDAWATATDALRTLGRDIDAAPAHSDPAPLRAQLEALESLACLENMAEAALPPFSSVIGARQWWHQGGSSWLFGLRTRQIVFPPEEIPALAREDVPAGDPLRSLLCSRGEPRCGLETRGYRVRAERAFRAHAEEHPEPRGNAADCLSEALPLPIEQRYVRWRSCMESTLAEQWVLPAGDFRAPSEGWLVVRGRRGHYSFCDGIAAYDLATGAAYSVASCSGLSLRSDGSVDLADTDASRGLTIVAGQMPLEHLREAAWMIFLAGRVEQRRTWAERVELPVGLERRVHGGLFGSSIGSFWVSSAQTQLSWRWVVDGRTRMEGTLTWPDSYRAAESHADDLLSVAEAGIVPGCTRAPLPSQLPIEADGRGVSRIDADLASRQRVEVSLIERLSALRAPRCRA